MSENQQTAQPENGLVVLLKENNVSEETALAISPAFAELYDLANEWKNKAAEYLNDENLSTEEKAKEARKARLALVKVRTEIDKIRKQLNEPDQQKITDRNTAAKVLTALVTPTEALLEAEEKRAENEEKERKTKIKTERLEKLSPYNVDCTYFDLENMPDQAFNQLLENSRLLYEKKVEDEKKLKEKADFEKRTADRKEQLVLLGFRSHESGAYVHKLFDVHEEIESYANDQWDRFTDKLAKEISDDLEAIRKEKEAEENRLKAEKEKAERETALLKQQEKERQHKHDLAIKMQGALGKINCVMSYDSLYGMTDEDFNKLFAEKNEIYQAEQNRLFIEKKKKEREEALKVEKEKRVQKRIEELSKLDFVFEENTACWRRDDIGAIVLITTMEILSDEEWVNGPMANISGLIYEKRAADLAPEKEKISTWVNSHLMPSINTEGFSESAKKTAEEIFQKFQSFNKWANNEINNLK